MLQDSGKCEEIRDRGIDSIKKRSEELTHRLKELNSTLKAIKKRLVGDVPEPEMAVRSVDEEKTGSRGHLDVLNSNFSKTYNLLDEINYTVGEIEDQI